MDKNSTRFEKIKFGKLIACVSRLHRSRTDQYLEHIGLYGGQAMLLIILNHHDGMTHSEIAERLEISPASATKVIKRMEALHYLKRCPDPTDERVSRVFLEDEGRAVIQQILQVFSQVDQILLHDFTPEEQEQLHHLLNRVYENLLNPPSELA